jgi:hypothetical protein
MGQNMHLLPAGPVPVTVRTERQASAEGVIPPGLARAKPLLQAGDFQLPSVSMADAFASAVAPTTPAVYL